MFTVFNWRLNLELQKSFESALDKLDALLRSLTQQTPIYLLPRLKRTNLISTVSHSLQLSGIKLNAPQVTAILEHRPLLAATKDIAIAEKLLFLYRHTASFNPLNFRDLCRAHQLLMAEHLPDAGQIRSSELSFHILQQLKISAPSPEYLEPCLEKLFEVQQQARDVHPIFSASVMSCALIAIQPFSDANGLIARLWRYMMMQNAQPIIALLPFDKIVFEWIDKFERAFHKAVFQNDLPGILQVAIETINAAIGDFSPMVARYLPKQGQAQYGQQQRRLLNVFEHEHSALELAQLLGYDELHLFYRDYLDKALEAHLIRQSNPEENHPAQKRFILTDLGLEAKYLQEN